MLDALTTIINISFNMEVKVAEFNDGFEILDEFDSKVISLQKTCDKKSLR
jgi:hypothetical protein